MELPPSEDSPSVTPRRDLLKLAMATGAGLALGAASSARAANPSAGETNASPPPPAYKFKLGTLKPHVDNAGGSVAECDQRNFPIVQRGGAGIFLLKLQPGGLREPHWHPNCWEMDYVVSGTVEMTIVDPTGLAGTFILEAGDVAFVPQGYAHSILNIGSVEAVIPITFNNSLPDDIGLSTVYAEFPVSQFAQTFGVPSDALSKIPRPTQTLFVVPQI